MLFLGNRMKQLREKNGVNSIQATSINQQDANGFTALIKACANGENECRNVLLKAGADKKIVDIEDMDYQDRYNEYLEQGPMKFRHKSKKHKKSSK